MRKQFQFSLSFSWWHTLKKVELIPKYIQEVKCNVHARTLLYILLYFYMYNENYPKYKLKHFWDFLGLFCYTEILSFFDSWQLTVLKVAIYRKGSELPNTIANALFLITVTANMSSIVVMSLIIMWFILFFHFRNFNYKME